MWIVSDKSTKNPLILIKPPTHLAIKITKLLVKIFIWRPHTIMLSSQDKRHSFYCKPWDNSWVFKRSLKKNFWAGLGIPQQLSTAKQVEQHGLVPHLRDKGVWPTGNTTKFAKISWPTGLHTTRHSSTLQSTTPTDSISSYRRWQLPSILEKVSLVLGCTDTVLELLWWTEKRKAKYF